MIKKKLSLPYVYINSDKSTVYIPRISLGIYFIYKNYLSAVGILLTEAMAIFKYLLVVDFEATCEADNSQGNRVIPDPQVCYYEELAVDS